MDTFWTKRGEMISDGEDLDRKLWIMEKIIVGWTDLASSVEIPQKQA
jgi:hypothetical protein